VNFIERIAREIIDGFWAGMDFIFTGASDDLDVLLDRLW
jgi:hypothetical protein